MPQISQLLNRFYLSRSEKLIHLNYGLILPSLMINYPIDKEQLWYNVPRCGWYQVRDFLVSSTILKYGMFILKEFLCSITGFM